MVPKPILYTLLSLAIASQPILAMADSNANLPGAPLFAPDGKSSKYIPHEQVLEVLFSTAPVRTSEGQDAFYTKDGWYLLLETPENTDRILKMGDKYEPIRLEPGQGHR